MEKDFVLLKLFSGVENLIVRSSDQMLQVAAGERGYTVAATAVRAFAGQDEGNGADCRGVLKE